MIDKFNTITVNGKTILTLKEFKDGELTMSDGREFHRNGARTKKENLKLLILKWLHESLRLWERELHRDNDAGGHSLFRQSLRSHPKPASDVYTWNIDGTVLAYSMHEAVSYFALHGHQIRISLSRMQWASATTKKASLSSQYSTYPVVVR